MTDSVNLGRFRYVDANELQVNASAAFANALAPAVPQPNRAETTAKLNANTPPLDIVAQSAAKFSRLNDLTKTLLAKPKGDPNTISGRIAKFFNNLRQKISDNPRKTLALVALAIAFIVLSAVTFGAAGLLTASGLLASKFAIAVIPFAMLAIMKKGDWSVKAKEPEKPFDIHTDHVQLAHNIIAVRGKIQMARPDELNAINNEIVKFVKKEQTNLSPSASAEDRSIMRRILKECEYCHDHESDITNRKGRLSDVLNLVLDFHIKQANDQIGKLGREARNQKEELLRNVEYLQNFKSSSHNPQVTLKTVAQPPQPIKILHARQSSSGTPVDVEVRKAESSHKSLIVRQAGPSEWGRNQYLSMEEARDKDGFLKEVDPKYLQVWDAVYIIHPERSGIKSNFEKGIVTKVMGDKASVDVGNNIELTISISMLYEEPPPAPPEES